MEMERSRKPRSRVKEFSSKLETAFGMKRTGELGRYPTRKMRMHPGRRRRERERDVSGILCLRAPSYFLHVNRFVSRD